MYLRDVTERVRAETELAASRVRIVQTADLERRRLERNLHDGAQQRLVGLALALRLAEDRVARDPDGGRRLLRGPAPSWRGARRAARARPRDPPRRAQRPRAACRAAGARSTLPRRDRGRRRRGRLDEAVEVAAYFTVSEALANVAKYSQASRAQVTATVRDGWLEVTVVDDGVGGADPERGSGLQGLLDRVGALGGTLTITSPHGAGTRLEVRLPVG